MALKGLSVTLVEANEHARLALYHMLSGWRMQVTELQALEQLHDHLETDTLASTDYFLLAAPASLPDPSRLTPLVERLLDTTGKPVIVLTAHADALSGQLSGHAEQCRVLGKPPTRRRLRDGLLELGGLAEPACTGAACGGAALHARVLVVDDHPGNLKLARVFLEEMGVDVVPCAGGEEALTAFSRGTFDLVFMDVQMPGMDGLETTRQMREREGEGLRTPIIALTAHALESERRSLLAAGMDDYLSKPITEGQLRHTLERWTRTDGVEAEPVAEEAPAAPEPAATDLVVDEALGKQRAGGREDLARDMFSMLLASLEQDAPGINALSESNNPDALLERVHKLHGACRYCGTPRLERAARELEEGLKTEVDDGRLEHLVAALLAEIESVRQYGQAARL